MGTSMLELPIESGALATDAVSTAVPLAEGPRLAITPTRRWRRSMMSCSLSVTLHLTLAVLVGLWGAATLREHDSEPAVAIFSVNVPNEELPELTTIEFKTLGASLVDLKPQVETHGLAGGQSIGELLFASGAEPSNLSTSKSQRLTDPFLTSAWGTADLTATVKLAASGLGKKKTGGSGSGTGTGIGDGDSAGFFGLNPVGKRVVYVIDASRSMNRPHDSEAETRFKRVKLELVKAIANLPAESMFFIVFFKDEPVPMPAQGLEPATLSAKQKYLSWMQTVVTSGNTEPTATLAQALRMRPDVVYFMSDGDFDPIVRVELDRLPVTNTVIQTFAFDEGLPEHMQRAYDYLAAGDGVNALKLVKGKDLRITTAAFRGHKYLRGLAERHHGKLLIIP